VPKGDSPRGAITPPDFPATPPPPQWPSGDYAYTVDLVGTINNQLGKLTEAVDSLKEQSKEHGKEIKIIGKDIHAAKVVGAFLVLSSGFVGWVIHEVIQYLGSHPVK
jgi:hypothetical protein